MFALASVGRVRDSVKDCFCCQGEAATRPLLLAASLCLLSAPARSETPLRAHLPVYGQIVSLPLPAPFDAAPESETDGDGNYLLESVPAGQTLEDWSQMLTFSGAENLLAKAEGAEPGELAAWAAGQFEEGYRTACAGEVEAAPLSVPRIAGAKAAYAMYLGCGEVAGTRHGEAMVFLVIIGAQDLYTLQWAERAPPTADKPAMDARWTARMTQIASVALCPRVKGEAAPYASCKP